jgi:hypothetical protein
MSQTQNAPAPSAAGTGCGCGCRRCGPRGSNASPRTCQWHRAAADPPPPSCRRLMLCCVVLCCVVKLDSTARTRFAHTHTHTSVTLHTLQRGVFCARTYTHAHTPHARARSNTHQRTGAFLARVAEEEEGEAGPCRLQGEGVVVVLSRGAIPSGGPPRGEASEREAARCSAAASICSSRGVSVSVSQREGPDAYARTYVPAGRRAARRMAAGPPPSPRARRLGRAR